jgi:chitin disaccharide deacetylase
MKIIINADDFAVSENVNNTICNLHRKGIVSSATIIAAGKFFDHAIYISKTNPELDIGVHLCLDGNFNIGEQYSTLIDRNTDHFYNKEEITGRLKMFSVDESEIYDEYCLQIEKVLDQGIRISHLDHHHHLHLYLPALNSMIKAAKKFKIKYIRSQRMLLHRHISHMGYLYRMAHQIYLKSRLNTVDGYFNPVIADNSQFDEHYKRLSELFCLKNKVVEIMLHPRDMNDSETIFYSHKKVQDLISTQNLISYSDLK